jgi:hypothetical protein
MADGELRIACLVPSLTELLFDLGLGDRLVARTGYCIHPAAGVAKVPKVGGTKTVNLAKLERLAPTHCIVNVDENELATVEAIRGFVPEVVVTHPKTVEDNFALYAEFGARFGRIDAARRLAAALQAELDACRSLVLPVRQVLYLVWRAPWITVARDTYVSRLLAKVGWHTLPDLRGGEAGAARYPRFDFDRRLHPWLDEVERVLLATEPCAFGPADVGELAALLPGRPVQLIDGEHCSWYGSRAPRALAYLRAQALAADDAAPTNHLESDPCHASP